MAPSSTPRWVVGYGRTIDDVDRSVFDLVIEMDEAPLSNEARREELTMSLEPPKEGRMVEISVPTLVVVGEHDLPDIRAAALDLAEKLSEKEAVVIPGAAPPPQPGASKGLQSGPSRLSSPVPLIQHRFFQILPGHPWKLARHYVH